MKIVITTTILGFVALLLGQNLNYYGGFQSGTSASLAAPVQINSLQVSVQNGTCLALGQNINCLTAFFSNILITVDNETMQVCNVVAGPGQTTILQIGHSSCPNIDGRGFGGTIIATHYGPVSSVFTSYSYNKILSQLGVPGPTGPVGGTGSTGAQGATGPVGATGGSTLILQTNGTANGSQSALNLIAGTNITLSNTGGNTTITSPTNLPLSYVDSGTANNYQITVPAVTSYTNGLVLWFSPSNTSNTSSICQIQVNALGNVEIRSPQGLSCNNANSFPAIINANGPGAEIVYSTSNGYFTLLNPAAVPNAQFLPVQPGLLFNANGALGPDQSLIAILNSAQTFLQTQTFSKFIVVPGIQGDLDYSAAGTPVPTCNSGTKNLDLIVSDATSPTYLGTYTSGGTVLTHVLCNGSSWVTH